MQKYENYIGGAWTPAAAGETLAARDPADGRVFAAFAASDAADVDRAVAAARAAQPAWAALPLEERVMRLEGFADSVERRAEDIALAEHREMGKPIGVARQFIGIGIAGFRAAVAQAREYAFTNWSEGATGTTEVHRVPLGVVAEIVPWNFTVPQTLVNLGALLAAGNTVVVKPSEKASPSAAVMFEDHPLPDGVLNLVLGDGRAGRALAEHPGIDLVVFTGSVATGRSVARAAGGNLNRSILELGGKDAAIIDSGVDIGAVAMDVAAGSFLNSGQICTSMERIYVHEEIAEEFVAALLEASKAFSAGGPMEIGPLVDEGQAAIVEAHVADAVARGARVLAGGREVGATGSYFPPTVLSGITPDMVIAREETFGPVAPITVVDSFETALKLADDSDFGLAATVYSRDDGHLAAARALAVSMLWLNRWQGSDGIRESEPAGISGMGAVGGLRAYDAATRPMTVFVPHGAGAA
jgi:succinate-semialdehyde dehydrogenase/glutarate-semialdehyde dehydrogenase